MESGELLQSDSELDEEVLEEESSPSTVFIRLLKPVTYKAVGESTGQEYKWNGAGSIQEVDSEDVDDILDANNKKPNSCCGGKVGKVFELIE